MRGQSAGAIHHGNCRLVGDWSGRREISRGTIASRLFDRFIAVSQACADGLYGGRRIGLVDGGWGLVSKVEGMIHG